jgi:anhydro-N-acetylmuramic acid kinase
MNQQHFRVLGLMSGTSLDGLDIALVEFTVGANDYSFSIACAETISYPKEWLDSLKNAHLLSVTQLAELDHAYGTFLGETVLQFIQEKNLLNIDFISSHGHTVHHQPEKKVTVQIGNGPELAATTGLPIVCDFRVQDVLLGGQGAPLVPIGDALLFPEYDACLNLGGFANISFEQNGKRIAFDICAVNIVLNHLAARLGLAYDDNGDLARSGKLIPEVFEALNALPFFTLPPPKSLGREWTDAVILPLLLEHYSTPDLLHTFCEHAAYQIAQICLPFSEKQILATGGGVFNVYLIERMSALASRKFTIPNTEIVTHKEALIFAFLGVLRWLNRPNCLASVTGAPSNHSSGRIYSV